MAASGTVLNIKKLREESVERLDKIVAQNARMIELLEQLVANDKAPQPEG